MLLLFLAFREITFATAVDANSTTAALVSQCSVRWTPVQSMTLLLQVRMTM